MNLLVRPGIASVVILVASAVAAHATNSCRTLLADQSDWNSKLGFYVSLENESADGTQCQLNTLNIAMGVADGNQWRFIVVPRGAAWEFNHDYHVKATITSSAFTMSLDGVSLGQTSAGFTPLSGALQMSEVPGWASGSAAYFITQNSLNATASSGASLSVDNTTNASRPIPLQLLAPGTIAQGLTFPVAAGDSVSIDAVFRITSAGDAWSYKPYFDRYGQSVHATYPTKVTTDADLTAAAALEANKLAEWGVPTQFDAHGGFVNASWSDTATGFYHVVQRQSIYWLISPEGHPVFYIGLDTAPALVWDRTPVTGRTALFEWLPDHSAPYDQLWGLNSWGQNDGTQDFGFPGANLVRKYGADKWQQTESDLTIRRIHTWGFSGLGKWSTNTGDLPIIPVLNAGNTPYLDRHPDIFDANVQATLRAALSSQITPSLNDSRVVGWSFSNEYDGIVTAQEIQNILNMGSNVPAKRALLDQAVTFHGASIQQLATAWGLNVTTSDGLYASHPVPSSADMESLRQYYEVRYHNFLYTTIKEIDRNHLYFGFWIVPGWWVSDADWDIAAQNCDVIGYDRYASTFSDDTLNALIVRTKKPVLCGEFSFPAHYNLMRGFHIYQSASAVDDAGSGAAYQQWVADAARHPYAIGVGWFQYRDEPVSGRGPGQGTDLVYGEDFAFGMVDVADQPKWDLVSRVRDANLAAAQRRLAFSPPALNDGGTVNNASFTAPVAPGSLISIFGSNLAGSSGRFSTLPLPSTLAGVRLTMGGVSVPIIDVTQPGQVDAQVPFELEAQVGAGTANLSITTDLLAGNTIQVKLAEFAPGIYSATSSGSGQGAILIDGTRLIASPANGKWSGRPAKAGEWLDIYCTGLGAVDNPPATGAASPANPLAHTKTKPLVSIGGVPANVSFSGLAPGFVGLYQVNAQVPSGVTPGDSVPVALSIGGIASNTVTIAVQ